MTTKASQDSANKLREKAMVLSALATKSALDFAEAIYEIYYCNVAVGGGELPAYKFFGYDTWGSYVEEELGLHITTAASYRRVHDVFMIQLKDNWDSSLVTSLTKFRSIVRVVDAKNVNSWLKKAKRLSCCALEEEVLEELYGKRKTGAHRHFLAMLTDWQLVKTNSILEIGFQEFPNCDSRGEVLVKILEQWDAAMSKHPKRHLRSIRGGKAASA